MREVTFLLILSLLFVAPARGQSPNATINGIVLDPSGAASRIQLRNCLEKGVGSQ